MDKRSLFLSDFIKKELELQLFDLTIDGIVVYGFLCRELRKKYMQSYFPSTDKDVLLLKKKSSLKYTIISFLQILKLSVINKRIDNFVYSFYRVDKVGDMFLDKFTDPLIDNSSIKKSYIIFEKSNNFEHKKPRLHSSKLVYTDYIEQKAIKYAKNNKDSFILRYKNELELLWRKLDLLMGEVPYSKDWTVIRLLRDKSMMDFYHSFFIKHNIKRFIAPCRAVFLPHMYVCKELNIPVLELQHGLNFGMGSITCLGYRDYHFVPDNFLSFEEKLQRERYGVENSRVINIGWAFSDYIKGKISDYEIKSNQVLVITTMSVDSLFRFIEKLAHNFPMIEFHIRLHPLARMTEKAQKIVKENKNIELRDNTINIYVELSRYRMVIGDNSTVLVEALGNGKKVGRICYDDMIPIYYNNEEKDAEWEISDIDSFKRFLESPIIDNFGFKLYSPFNSASLEEVLKQ